MAISYGEPKNRIEHFKRKFLKFDIQTIKICKKGNDPKIHYIYLCKKLEGADNINHNVFEECLKELDNSEISVEYIEAYKDMEKAFEEKKVKAIGLSNFKVNEIKEILGICKIKPAIN